jgi:hypothetical protein
VQGAEKEAAADRRVLRVVQHERAIDFLLNDLSFRRQQAIKSNQQMEFWAPCESAPRVEARSDSNGPSRAMFSAVNEPRPSHQPEDASTNKGDRVAFRLADLYLPAPEEVLAAFSAATEVDGTVIDFSDGGGRSRVFAVVRVVQERTVVVPVDKLKLISENEMIDPPKP